MAEEERTSREETEIEDRLEEIHRMKDEGRLGGSC